MKNMEIRKAIQSELDQIYMMGFDVWSEGTETDYLTIVEKFFSDKLTTPEYF